MQGFKGRLHVLTDTVLQNKFSHFELAQKALAGGADVIQYRNKNYHPETDRREIEKILNLKKQYNFTFIINDSPEEAILCGADGCHIGAEDIAPDQAIQLFRKAGKYDAVLGVTVHNLEELKRISIEGVSYIGLGPVFGTTSKNIQLPALGLEKFSEICQLSSFPVIAIGNIQAENMRQVLDAGASGVAVLGAVCLAPDPEKAVQKFASLLF